MYMYSLKIHSQYTCIEITQHWRDGDNRCCHVIQRHRQFRVGLTRVLRHDDVEHVDEASAHGAGVDGDSATGVSHSARTAAETARKRLSVDVSRTSRQDATAKEAKQILDEGLVWQRAKR